MHFHGNDGVGLLSSLETSLMFTSLRLEQGANERAPFSRLKLGANTPLSVFEVLLGIVFTPIAAKVDGVFMEGQG